MGDLLASPVLITLQKTPLQGTYTIVHVATSPSLGNDSKAPTINLSDLNTNAYNFSDITENKTNMDNDDDDGGVDMFLPPNDYVSEEIVVGGGDHYFHGEVVDVSEAAKHRETAIRLWMVSEKLTGLAH